MRVLPIFILPFAIAACAEGTEPEATPMDGPESYDMIEPVPAPVSPVAATPLDGEWRSGSVEGFEALIFHPAGAAAPVAALVCDERRGLVIERRGLVPTGEMSMMSFGAGRHRQNLAASPAEGEQGPVLRATLPFNADMIAVLQREPVPMQIDVDEGQKIAMPGSPLVPQLIDTCRRT